MLAGPGQEIHRADTQSGVGLARSPGAAWPGSRQSAVACGASAFAPGCCRRGNKRGAQIQQAAHVRAAILVGMPARPGQQQPPKPRDDPGEDTLAEYAAAVDRANQDVVKEARGAKRRQAARKVAGSVAEVAVSFAAEIISSIIP